MKIALLGDIALFGKNNSANLGSLKQSFSEVKHVLSNCDYVIGNLETPLTNATKVVGGKSAYIKGKPEDVLILKELGVTHVSLANNHSFDFRAEGLTETIRVLDNANIAWFGVNGRSEYIRGDNCCVALHGYTCYSTNPRGIRQQIPNVNVLSPFEIEKQMKEDVENNRFPILALHWGEEHVHMPNFDHVQVARKLMSCHKGVIYGHHPHVIQGIENVNGNVVAYSLGNFCFDDVYTNKSKKPLIKLSVDNQESFILVLTIENNALTSYDVIPFSFISGSYRVDMTIKDRIEEWTVQLYIPEDEYISRRTADINKYLQGRKKMRDLEWYIKRLNIESLKMILYSRYNAKRYNEIVKAYIRQ